MTALAKKPLCGQCSAGWLEDDNGNITGRCPCRNTGVTPEQARDDGMAATVEANPEAKRAALRIIHDIAARRETFSANDCRTEMTIAQVPGPVVGAAFAQAVRNGWVRRDGYLPSSQTATHGHPIACWRSLIYRPGRNT